MLAHSVARLVAVLGTMVLAIGLMASPSHSAPTKVTTEERAWAPLFYDNIVTGGDDPANTLILFTGVTVEQTCAEDFGAGTFLIRTQGEPPTEGARVVERLVTRAPFYVYEGNGLDSVEFLDEVCPALADGGPPPTLLARGHGLVRQRISSEFHGDSAPDVTDDNSAVGVVRTTDGSRWAVRGEAELTYSPEFSVDHVAFKIRGRR